MYPKYTFCRIIVYVGLKRWIHLRPLSAHSSNMIMRVYIDPGIDKNFRFKEKIVQINNQD